MTTGKITKECLLRLICDLGDQFRVVISCGLIAGIERSRLFFIYHAIFSFNHPIPFSLSVNIRVGRAGVVNFRYMLAKDFCKIPSFFTSAAIPGYLLRLSGFLIAGFHYFPTMFSAYLTLLSRMPVPLVLTILQQVRPIACNSNPTPRHGAMIWPVPAMTYARTTGSRPRTALVFQ